MQTKKALILAGGRGTRLWPLSRKQKPKQFQRLISRKTMLQETVDRLLPEFALEDIFISTNKEYVDETRVELPKMPKGNIIAEPVSRERVAAISLFLARIKKEEFSQPILVLPSDHLIKKQEEFRKAISAAEKFTRNNPDYITILGAKPTFPDTGLGYIKKGKLLSEEDGSKIYQVDFFKEKPNLQRTRNYLKTGNYFWNTAIYFFTPSLIERAMKDFIPDSYARYKKIRQAGKDFNKVLLEEYPGMDNVGLEYSIIENYSKVAVIPADIDWSDVGSWAVLKNALASPDGNFIKGNYIGLDSKNIMIYGSTNKQLVAALGVKDLVVVVTDDIILICNKDDSQKVKQLIEKLEKQEKFNYI